MRFLIFAILIITPCIYSQSFNRVFEIPKTIFLFLGCGALTLGAGLICLQQRISMAEIRQKISHPISWWLIVYLTAFFTACLFSMAKPLSFLGSYERHTGFITMTLFTFFYFVFIVVLNKEDVHAVLKTVSLTGIGVALVAVFQSYGVFLSDLEYIYDMFYHRVFSTLSHPVYLGIYLIMIIPLAAAMIPTNPKANLGFALALPVMVFALVKTLSRGALIALGLEVFSFVYLYIAYMRRREPAADPSQRLNWRYALVSLLFLVSGIGLLFYMFPVLQLRLETLFHFPQESRAEIYKSIYQLIRDYPLFGTGPDTLRISFLPYKTLELARTFPMTNHDQAHNQFLHILATAGIFPFIAYVGFLATMILTHLRILRYPWASHRARALSLGITCATLGYIAAMMPAFDNMTTLLLLYVLAGATVLLQKSVFPAASGVPSGSAIRREPARYAVALMMSVAGIVFIAFGTSMWMAEHYSMAGNAAAKIENKVAYYEKASRWMPYETYYDYGLSEQYYNQASSRRTAAEKKTDFLRALAILENSLAYTWQPENYVNLIGKIFVELDNPKRTESIALKFLQFDRYSEGVRINLMLALSLQGRLDEALDLLARWLSEFPERDTYYWYAGMLYGEKQDFINAEMQLARASELNPGNASYTSELERVRRILQGIPEPAPLLMNNQEGLPIVALEPIPEEFAPVAWTNPDGSPVIVIENLADQG